MSVRAKSWEGALVSLLLVLSFLPTWSWYLDRVGDGSDEPWGVVALLTAVGILFTQRSHWTLYPRDALFPVILYAAASSTIPALVRGMIAVVGCAAFFGVFRERRYAVVMLLLLSLPLLSTAQFFAGYPLRALAGSVAATCLSLVGIPVTRVGAMLDHHGTLVWIDAPCSGIRTAWCASFVLAATTGVNGSTFRETATASLCLFPLVFIANVTRIMVLFLTESRLIPAPTWFHGAVGIVTALGVMTFAVGTVWFVGGASTAREGKVVGHLPAPGVSSLSSLLFALTSLAVVVLESQKERGVPAVGPVAVQWPEQFEGQPLVPIALSERDIRFGRDFPGNFARFRSAEKELLIRYVTRPTRKLHPTAECLRGMGYAVAPLPAERIPTGAVASCVRASQGRSKLKVCEHITDSAGNTFSDPSEWFWASTLGGSQGPWYDYVVSEEIST